VDGKFVRPQDIQGTSLLTVEGELDDISGAGQTRAAHDLCTGIPKERQFHYDVIGAGHYGIFSGRRWREKVYPEIKAFIRRFDQPVANAKALNGTSTKAITAQAATKAPVKTSARKAVAAPKAAARSTAQPAAKPAAKPTTQRAGPKR
jgi:poly(3-hydroxybutyrate) depolymerase